MAPEDKDAALFPVRFGGRWAMLHRPAPVDPWLGAHIWLSYSPDLRHWGDPQILLAARQGGWWDARQVGLGPPPLLTKDGWLLCYHGVRVTASGSIYRLGLALLDRDDPSKVLARGNEWVVGPREPYERHGDVPTVVFPCGWILRDDGDTLHIYYSMSLRLHSGDMAEFLDVAERAQLSDLFDELGPRAPTLLEPWTTRDLAAHLVLRERDYIAGPGLVLPGGWGRLAERRRRALALRDFAWLTATFRSGPPPGFFRIGWVRRVPSLNEFFVHHEDVRRANGRGPRIIGPAMDAALWRNVSRGAWFLARRVRGAGLELQWAGTALTVRARRGEPAACVAGPPGELLLWLFGRQSAARVEVNGPDAAVEVVRRARLGM